LKMGSQQTLVAQLQVGLQLTLFIAHFLQVGLQMFQNPH
jgi:hypothetical protein